MGLLIILTEDVLLGERYIYTSFRATLPYSAEAKHTICKCTKWQNTDNKAFIAKYTPQKKWPILIDSKTRDIFIPRNSTCMQVYFHLKHSGITAPYIVQLPSPHYYPYVDLSTILKKNKICRQPKNFGFYKGIWRGPCRKGLKMTIVASVVRWMFNIFLTAMFPCWGYVISSDLPCLFEAAFINTMVTAK